MKQIIFYAGLFCIGILLLHSSCRETPMGIISTYKYIEPAYQNIGLKPQSDTLHFPLGEYAYNKIRSFNYFTHKGKPFISFYDRGSRSIYTYDFADQRLVHTIPLKKWFIGEEFKKASTFVANFDSIFIISDNRLILLDSSSAIKKTIDLFEAPEAKAFSDNETPVVLINNMLYMGVQPALSETSLKGQRKWRVMCVFNLQNGTKELQYHLPTIYQENLYGYSFWEYSYCINDQGNFVFSFPADTNIYETNLADIHNAYYAKSRFQTMPITPVSEKLLNNHESFKEYSIRDSYGTIYYDPYKKRYLRLAKQKINETDFIAKNRIRKKSVIILNEEFKIIGESLLDDKFEFRFIFFTPEGMYARVKFSDEQALHFIRLDYDDAQNDSLKIVQK